jgi:hypothetical protein
MLHRWLLASPYVTTDPADAGNADFYFVPLYLSLGNYDLQYGYYGIGSRGFALMRRAIAYVRRTWPFWNATGGARHLLTLTNDKGGIFTRGAMAELKHVSLVTHWGWRRPHIFVPGLDLAVPPMLKVGKLVKESPYVHPPKRTAGGRGGEEAAPRYLLSFIGSIRPHTPGYSFGVRRAV